VRLIFGSEVTDVEVLKSGDKKVISQTISVLPKTEVIMQEDRVSVSNGFDTVGQGQHKRKLVSIVASDGVRMEKGGRVAEGVQSVKSLRVPEEWVIDVEQVGIQGGLVELMTKVYVVCSSTVTNARD
jgi:hypothetical protein